MNMEERLAADGFAGVEPELFYGKRTHGSNFQPKGIWLTNPWTNKLEFHATGEHAYQARKAKDVEAFAYVNAASSAFQSKQRGREIELRDGWGDRFGDLCWYVMFEVVLAKTLQHSDVKAWLLSTEDRPIYEDSPTDDIWGWRYHDDYRGRNLLGRCWMNVRRVMHG